MASLCSIVNVPEGLGFASELLPLLEVVLPEGFAGVVEDELDE